MKYCETCDREWPEGKHHPGFFGLYPYADLNESEHATLGEIQYGLVSQTRALFHAIFCTWYYEHDNHGGMEHQSVVNLTDLGQALCEEINRLGERMDRVAKTEQAEKKPEERKH